MSTPEFPFGMWREPESGPGAHHHAPGPVNPRRANEDFDGVIKRLALVLGVAPRHGQGGGGPGFVVRNGVYVPLQYVDPNDALQGGYGYCDLTDGGMTFHPGVDLNSGSYCDADLGAEVVASVDGVVLAVLPWNGNASGEGNHLWIHYDDPRCVQPAYAHFDHLYDFTVNEGQRFQAGDLLGHCGKSGNWSCAHLHHELLRVAPSSWWQWPYGWSLSQVQGTYFSPRWWYEETVARAGLSQGQEEDVRTTTTPEEREAVRPYFEQLGVAVNMDTALMQRACLAYYRDENPGPAMTTEYPWGSDSAGFVRQTFTSRTGEWHPDGTTYWVEINKEAA